MIVKIKLILLSLALIALAGSVQAVGIQKRVNVQRDLNLKIGGEEFVREAGLKVKFVAMVEDSRCPEGVDCIWAGNGKISLTVRKGKYKAVTFDLNTTSEPRSFIYQGYEITLVKLAPYPKNDVKILDCEYVATLNVTSAKK
jgi:hypothetical protein